MIPSLLTSGTTVATKNGNGIIIKVDTDTYSIPMYHVLLTNDKYADEVIYISDPRITPEIHCPAPEMTAVELNLIRADLEFDTMRDLVTGTVTCRKCGVQYHEIQDVTIRNISTDEPEFYCVICGERL